jgi:glycosyltransferase involved in cell wall biosynthesis
MKEISVVLPCLNEQDSIGICIDKIQKVYSEMKVDGDIIVVDNGSTDRSVEIAKSKQVRVYSEPVKGYGSALRRGIDESDAKYVVMADSDDTYDFLELPKFIDKLREGYDLVMGSRFRGNILPGAMTWSHRYIGNPILSGILRVLFGGGVSDSHCGLRGFSKDAYKRMGLHTTGMEFASEMVIHAIKKKLKTAEIPITYYPRKGESKLVGIRDAWRHMRFMLLYSPNHLFMIPAGIIFVAGFVLLLRLLFGPIYFAGRSWDLHVAVFASMLSILGWQVLNLGFAAKVYIHVIGLEETKTMKKILDDIFTLERALVLGSVIFLAGLLMSCYIILIWAKGHFGELAQFKNGIFSLTMIVMGLQTIFTSFLTSVLQIKYR